MNRYADLRKNPITSLEGNLVVSNRKRTTKTAKPSRDYPIGLWIVIIIMFGISGFYIRYQALYIEDSVFRDAYLLIDEHFLSKEPLPPPNQVKVGSDTTDLQAPTVISPNNSKVTTAPSSTSTSQLAPVYPSPQPANQAPLSANQISPPSDMIRSTSPITSLGLPQNTPGHSSLGGQIISTAVPQNNPPASSTLNPQSTSQVLQINPSKGDSVKAVIPQTRTFSLYHPILNSKSTKVGFFVVNQKIEYNQDQLYQALFMDLVNFKSSNPLVKNFFDNRSRLNQAWIENDTLLLDFNSYFENSKYGYKGIEVKIQQVLWTFFNFRGDQVNKIGYISFLINGKRKDVIGGDGKTLKPFYSRKDLNSVITL